MSNVIKASRARLIPPEKSDIIICPAEPEPEPELEPEELSVPDEAPGEAEKDPEEIRAAYEDLLATAQNEVALMMEDAKKEAGQIRKEAAREAESVVEQERRRGFEEGYAEGHPAGVADARGQCGDILAKAQEECDRALREAYEAKDRLLQESEPRMLALALDIARKILGYELQNNEDAFMGMVKTAVSSLNGESRVTLHVHSDEYLQVFQSQESLRIPTPNGHVAATVKIDPSAPPGGCMVETDSGSMDISVEAQLEQIAVNLGLEPGT